MPDINSIFYGFPCGAANIAAGASRNTSHASVACLRASLRQLHEVCDHIGTSCELGFLSEEAGSGLVRECRGIISRLKELIAQLVN